MPTGFGLSVPRHRFRQSITVQRNTPTQTAGGAHKDSWATLLTAKVNVQMRGGAEAVRAGRDNTREFGVIYGATDDLSGVTAKDRIVFGSRTFGIITIRDIDTQTRLTHIEIEEVLP